MFCALDRAFCSATCGQIACENRLPLSIGRAARASVLPIYLADMSGTCARHELPPPDAPRYAIPEELAPVVVRVAVFRPECVIG